MCVLSIKVPIRKMSGNLSYAPHTLCGLLLSKLDMQTVVSELIFLFDLSIFIGSYAKQNKRFPM